VRHLAYEAADCGLLSADLAAGIRRVKGVKKLGIRLGNRVTAEQGNALWQAPDRQRLKGKRDRALLALLPACGLRRHEAGGFDIGSSLITRKPRSRRRIPYWRDPQHTKRGGTGGEHNGQGVAR
jgi:integrase